MTKIRIVLADDHVVVRQGVRALIDQEKDMVVVGETSDGLQLQDMAEKLRPDIVVVDLKMPNLNGIDAAHEIQKRFPKTRAVILTMYADRAYIERAIQAGVYGYVLKDEDSWEVCTAIRHAAQGNRYWSPAVSERIPDFINESISSSNPILVLSTRERTVFQLLAEGKTNKEVAQMLGISKRTAEVHRAHIMSKLNLRSHIDFARFAIQHGILADSKE